MRQEHLPDVPGAPVYIEEISEAQRAYRKTMEERIKLTAEESALQDNLLALLDKHNLKAYRDAEYETVIVPGQRKAKVKKTGAEEKDSAPTKGNANGTEERGPE